MANNENLKPVRTKSEARERGRNGGKASGESRRRKAAFRKTLNLLLTAKIDSPEWTPLLEALGLESTLESAMLMAQIKEAMKGNTKAAYFVAQYAGQSSQTEADEEEQRIRTVAAKARTGMGDGDDERDDGFLDALQGAVKDDWAGYGPPEGEDEAEKTDIQF